MEQDLTKIYRKSAKDITKKWNQYMEQGEKRLSALRESGSIRKYQQALGNYTLKNQHYKDMVDSVTLQLAHVNETALAYTQDQLPEIYAINYNQAVETADEVGISFTLINGDVVKRMVRDGDIELPNQDKRLNIPKDQRWNTKQLNSSVLQGILQGESMDKIANRILPIVGRNESAAIRNARTMVTGAENRGRLDSYKQLGEDGLVLKKVWMATPDGRTRDWHIDMDGQEVGVDENFVDGLGNELEYPGDPGGAPETVYNCRCTMVTDVVGFRRSDGSISYIDYEPEGESFHEQQMAKEKENRKSKETNQKQNKKEPDKDGAMRGVPKTGEKVDLYSASAKVNPRYGEGKEYEANCANCVIAVELQQRGYDVKAAPRDFKAKIAYFWHDNKHGRGSWTDSFTSMDAQNVKATRKNNIEKNIANLMKDYGVGSRAVVFVQWDGYTVGHYFNVSNENGEIIYADGQNGKTGSDVTEYFDRCRPSKTWLFRTDDKELDEFVRKVVTWDGKN